MNTRLVNCETCKTEGRIYSGHSNDPDPRDEGPCPACNGECVVEIETQPVEIQDLDWECENCIGMIEHGCYCKAVGAVAPGGPLSSKLSSDQRER